MHRRIVIEGRDCVKRTFVKEEKKERKKEHSTITKRHMRHITKELELPPPTRVFLYQSLKLLIFMKLTVRSTQTRGSSSTV